jgi:hypothetical protein
MSDSDIEKNSENIVSLTQAELEQKLKEAEAKGFADGFERTRFIMMHELANRISSARGFAEFLSLRKDLSPEAMEWVKKIIESNIAVADFLGDLAYAVPEKVQKIDLMGNDAIDLKSASSKIGGSEEYTDFT